MKEEEIKKYLQEARRKGWWIACLYWENKLEKLTSKSADIEEIPQLKGTKEALDKLTLTP